MMSRPPQARNGGGVESIPSRAGFEGDRSGGAEDGAGTSRSRGSREGMHEDGGSDSDAE
jgi:hypothetical protein